MTATNLPDAVAAAIAAGAAAPTGTHGVPCTEAVGRVAAEDVVAPASLPGFDGSAMDGYAVRAADTAAASDGAPVVLALVDEARAGHPAGATLHPGEALRISTGARISGGADAVVRVEDAEDSGTGVVLRRPVAVGADVRRAGEDVASGDVVVRRDEQLHPGTVALLAGLGIGEVLVRRPPTASVLVTGDEVTPPGRPLAPGGVHDVHGVALPALLRAAGCGAVDVTHVGDDPDLTLAALRSAPGDLIVTCGGMSVGRHDHVRRAMRTAGVRELVPRVRMKPGAPTSLGVLPGPDGDRPVLGLPGNPSAAMVAAILLAVPAVRAMTGAPPVAPLHARLSTDVRGAPGRHLASWVRLAVDDAAVLVAHPAALQHSHRLRTPADSDALAVVPPADGVHPAGAIVPVLRLPGAGPSALGPRYNPPGPGVAPVRRPA